MLARCEICWLQAGHTCLLPLGVHGFEFCDGVLFDVLLYQVYAVMVRWSFVQESRKANHVQRCRSFKRAMNVVVFASIPGLIEVGSQSAVRI